MAQDAKLFTPFDFSLQAPGSSLTPCPSCSWYSFSLAYCSHWCSNSCTCPCSSWDDRCGCTWWPCQRCFGRTCGSNGCTCPWRSARPVCAGSLLPLYAVLFFCVRGLQLLLCFAFRLTRYDSQELPCYFDHQFNKHSWYLRLGNFLLVVHILLDFFNCLNYIFIETSTQLFIFLKVAE